MRHQGTTLATAAGLDPEGSNVSYFLSGQGSDNFQIDADGNITLDGTLDYEGTQSYELTVFASDGLFTVPKTVTVTVTDANEAPSVSAAVAFNSFQETTAVGTTIATTTGIRIQRATPSRIHSPAPAAINSASMRREKLPLLAR
jgi:VCBS repeat-containing protein